MSKRSSALVIARIAANKKIKPETWGKPHRGPWDKKKVKKADGGDVVDAGKPAFDPSQPFHPVDDKPPFDPSKPFEAASDKGVTNAVARGAAQGVTGNFYDEMRGLVEAGGAAPNDPASLGSLVKGAYKYWTGDKDAEQRYNDAVSRERAESKEVQEQHPVAETIGSIGGALALPVGAGASAATLPARIARGAATGAGVGALYGVGSGETPTDRLVGGGTGALIGGLTGGVAPPLVEGATRAASAAARPIINTIRGAVNPEGEAGRRVVTALQRDFENQGPQFTPEETAVARAAGSPTAIIDAGGETTRALARSAANTSPEGREALADLTQSRFGTQNQRTADFVQRLTGASGDNAGDIDALRTAAQAANRPAYARAYQEGDREIFTPEMEQLVGAPAVAEAMRRASTSGKDRAIIEGYGAFNPGVSVENGVVTFRRGPNGVPTYPNLAFWDATKKELDDAAGAAARGGRNGEASVLQGLSQRLRNALDDEVPSYASARAGAARAFGAQDAMEAGANFVNSRMENSDAQRALARMSPAERQLFRHGYASTLINKIDEMGDRQTVLNKMAQSPADRERLELALGPQRSRALEAFLRVEAVMDRARTAVTGNSTTARQLAELGLAGGAYGIAGHGDLTDPRAVATGALVWGLTHGRNRVDERVARRVGEMLSSNDPNVLQRGIETIARHGRIFDQLRRMGGFGSKVAGQQAPSKAIRLMQGPIPASADDKKKQP